MKCKGCRFYVFTCCLSSLDEPIWHCRFGFSPTDDDCVSEAEDNLRRIRAFYKKHPDELQLKLNFK